MARRPGYRKWQHVLLTALLLSVSVTAQALGIATPEVMSGFNEPLKARVALLNTGSLRADDIRVSLADSARWQAMEVVRSADTDTLRLAVDGRPGHLYLEVRGSRPLATPWLDVVVTLRWPQGELTPQLTLLPSAASDQKTTPAAASSTRLQSAPQHERSSSVSARDASSAAAESARMAALEARLNQLEQQLRDAQTTQSATMADLAALRTQSADQTLPDVTELQALTSRQQSLESRLDQLDQKVMTANVTPSEPVAANSAPQPAALDAAQAPTASPRKAAVAPEPAAVGRDHDFVWTWLLAALLMVLVGTWAGLRRWRQRRYRLVSVEELSPSGGTGTGQERAVADGEMDSEYGTADSGVTDEVWTAHRAQVEAICSEAEVFYRHDRYDHAITMLKEGLELYPNDIQLMRALAAMEAARDRGEAQGELHIPRQSLPVSAAVEETPELAPAWSLTALSNDEVPVEEASTVDDTMSHVSRVPCEKVTDPIVEPSVGFPGNWALEEVASGGFDADNERPDADRLLRHA